ncbi:uncharacterized protein [Antedon mediterranea]|uniref:uncharacterized protein n=1 Tax=Antedon mediterranea TaxID=105859 RepID=UPI003AF5E9EA
MEDLENLVTSDIAIGREKLINNSWNLSEIATQSEEAFKKAQNKEAEIAVTEQTKYCVTNALASVADQINTLTSDLKALIEGEVHEMKILDYEVNQLEMKGKAFDSKRDMKRISKFASRKFTKEIRRKTKRHVRAHHKKRRYISTAIDYGALDKVGHGMIFTQPLIADIKEPKSPLESNTVRVKDRTPRKAVPEPAWESPREIPIEPDDGTSYDYITRTTSSDYSSTTDDADSENQYYEELNPVNGSKSFSYNPFSSLNRRPEWENVPNTPSLRLRKMSDSSSIAQTPTPRGAAGNYFMFLKNNTDEYATFENQQTQQQKRDYTPPALPERQLGHSISRIIDKDERIYEEPALEQRIEEALNELDDATNSIYVIDDLNYNGVDAPPLDDANDSCYVTDKIQMDLNYGVVDSAQPPPPLPPKLEIPLPGNTDEIDHCNIPNPPPITQKLLQCVINENRLKSPKEQHVTQKVHEQSNTPTQSQGPVAVGISSDLIKQLKENLRPSSRTFNDVAIGRTPLNLSEKSEMQQNASPVQAKQINDLSILNVTSNQARSKQPPTIPEFAPNKPRNLLKQIPTVPNQPHIVPNQPPFVGLLKPPPIVPKQSHFVPNQPPIVPNQTLFVLKPPPTLPKHPPSVAKKPPVVAKKSPIQQPVNKQPPSVPKKPPGTKPKPRPKSEVPRPSLEEREQHKPLQFSPNVNCESNKTPPPPPPKTKPKPAKIQRFSMIN